VATVSGRVVTEPNGNVQNDLRSPGGAPPAPWHTRCDIRGVPQIARRHGSLNGLRRRRSNDTALRCHHTSGGVMSQLVAIVNTLRRNEEGQDLLEYALLVALIALVAIGAVTAAGASVSNIFGAIAGALGGAA